MSHHTGWARGAAGMARLPWVAAFEISGLHLSDRDHRLNSSNRRRELLATWFKVVIETFGQFRLQSCSDWFLAVFAGALPVTFRIALLPAVSVPLPSIHDEFSYLLAADTFAHLKLTNAPHPLWQFFESFHINQQPTYCSMYPVGQGIFLALGQLLFGHPWFGVCLSIFVLGLIGYWALRGWFAKRWALAGALWPTAFYTFSYWGNSYWGGAVAASAGFLVLGVVGRVRNRPSGIRSRNGVLLGIGSLVLLCTRPWEGFVYFAGIMIFGMGRFWFRNAGSSRRFWIRFAVPFAITSGLGLGCVAYYFWRTTGSPIQPPYLVNRQTYAVSSLFVFQKDKPVPTYHHAIMRDFYTRWEPAMKQRPASVNDYLKRTWHIFGMFLVLLTPSTDGDLSTFHPSIFLNTPLKLAALVAFFGVYASFKMTKVRWILGLLLFAQLAVQLQSYLLIHYLAPMLGAEVLLLVAAVRFYALSNRRLGPMLGLGTLFALIVSVVLFNAWRFLDDARLIGVFPLERAAIIRQLEQIPGRHLVFVRYSPEHDVHNEWVYNGSDIDRARIVWARATSEGDNGSLRRYFTGSRVWLLQPDFPQPRLELVDP